MSKMQKVWLWIFGAMFLVPEILWGDLIKILKIPILPFIKNDYYFTNNPGLSFLVIIVEIIGISGIIYLLNRKSNINIKFKVIFDLLLVIVLLLLLLSLFLSYTMSRINF